MLPLLVVLLNCLLAGRSSVSIKKPLSPLVAATCFAELAGLLLGPGRSVLKRAVLLAVPAVRYVPVGSLSLDGGTYAGCLPLTMYVCWLSGVTTISLPVNTLPISLQGSSTVLVARLALLDRQCISSRASQAGAMYLT